MIPLSIGTNTHTHGAHGHQDKAHGAHGKKGGKSSPFESSLEGALSEDDAADKLEGASELVDDRKSAKKGEPSPADLAALAFVEPAPKAEPVAPPPDDAKLTLDPKDAKVGPGGAKLAPKDALDPATLAPPKLDAAVDPKASAATDAKPVLTAADLRPVEAPAMPVTPNVVAPAPSPGPAAEPSAARVAAPPPPPIAPAPAPAAQVAQVAATLPKPEPRTDAKPAKAEPRAAAKTEAVRAQPAATTTAADASTAPQARVSSPQPARSDADANDRQPGGREPGKAKPPTVADDMAKKAKVERAQDADMSADVSRVTASMSDGMPAPVVAPTTEAAKTLTAPAAATNPAENTVQATGGKTEDTIKAAEAAGHKRTLASGEARGQIETAELGRVEVVAHAAAHEASRVDVHVRAIEEHAKQVISANAESLREHVRVEVPNAAVHVERPQNDLLGNGASARDLAQNSGQKNAEGEGRGGRDDAPAARGETVKNPAPHVKGARVRFVL